MSRTCIEIMSMRAAFHGATRVVQRSALAGCFIEKNGHRSFSGMAWGVAARAPRQHAWGGHVFRLRTLAAGSADGRQTAWRQRCGLWWNECCNAVRSTVAVGSLRMRKYQRRIVWRQSRSG
jgi:hypothetical protein